MTRYALYAWRPDQLDPRTLNLDKAQLLQNLSGLAPRPPHNNQDFIELALAIEHWAQNQRLTDVFDRITIKAYEGLADHYRSTPMSHFVLHQLPSINFDSFYYMVITTAIKLGLIIHSDIDNGTYYPDYSSIPVFLMSRLDKLNLKRPAPAIVSDLIKLIDTLGSSEVTGDKPHTVLGKGINPTLSALSASLVGHQQPRQANLPPHQLDPNALSPSLSDSAMALASEDSELLTQLKQVIEAKLQLLDTRLMTAQQASQQQLQAKTTRYKMMQPLVYELQKRPNALAWDMSFLWHDSQVTITFLLERNHFNEAIKLDSIFKIVPPLHYKDAQFGQLFSGPDSINIMYKSKLFIEASLKDVEQYNALLAQTSATMHRSNLKSLAQLGQQVDQDIDFIKSIFENQTSFYQLFDTIYQDNNHPLHQFYWGPAEPKPLTWSRFSRRHNMFLTLARLLQHPKLPQMIEEQRPILLAYYDRHSEMMPIMMDLKAQFLKMCDKLRQGYQPAPQG
ncbi:MAG: hypothetical protein Q4P13_10060 [Psychrobacter sp.]|nr:hypothetical protein [Psychrobacter sp.]